MINLFIIDPEIFNSKKNLNLKLINKELNFFNLLSQKNSILIECSEKIILNKIKKYFENYQLPSPGAKSVLINDIWKYIEKRYIFLDFRNINCTECNYDHCTITKLNEALNKKFKLRAKLIGYNSNDLYNYEIYLSDLYSTYNKLLKSSEIKYELRKSNSQYQNIRNEENINCGVEKIKEKWSDILPLCSEVWFYDYNIVKGWNPNYQNGLIQFLIVIEPFLKYQKISINILTKYYNFNLEETKIKYKEIQNFINQDQFKKFEINFKLVSNYTEFHHKRFIKFLIKNKEIYADIDRGLDCFVPVNNNFATLISYKDPSMVRDIFESGLKGLNTQDDHISFSNHNQ